MKIDNVGCPHGCNSLGQILYKGKWLPCPIHGKKQDILLTSGKLPDGQSLFDVLQIPIEYQGDWVTDISRMFLNEDIQVNCFKESISQLKYILETLYNVIAIENNLYLNSLYVYANPRLLDLKSYVFTIQRIAFENNLSVLPATSVNDLAGLLELQEYSSIKVSNETDVGYISKLNRLAGEGADWNLRTGLTYTDYLRCSICVIFDNNASLDNNLRILSGFLEERSRRGLPTYVFSTCFFDTKRENLFYDKSGRRKLSSLTPYLLMGKNQEVYAREHGWLKNKSKVETGKANSLIHGYTFQDFDNKEKVANTFDL